MPTTARFNDDTRHDAAPPESAPIDQTMNLPADSSALPVESAPDTLHETGMASSTPDQTLSLPAQTAFDDGYATLAPPEAPATSDMTLSMPDPATIAPAPQTLAPVGPDTHFPVDSASVRSSDAPSTRHGGQPSAPSSESPTRQVRGARRPLTVAGYEIISELGRGGMGVVYQARHLKLNRVVALKMIRNSAQAGREELMRFRLEAEAAARMQHPNIVQIYEIGEHEGLPFFSLEYVEGGTLSQRLKGDPLPARHAAALVEALARAMHYAHGRGILHRDLKPANIMLQEFTAPEAENADSRKNGKPASPSSADVKVVAKITDFGLAKKIDDDGSTGDGSILGTPSYMAPEQAQGRTKELGPAADIYSLGAILYDLLTGRPPFRGDTVMDTLHQVIHIEPMAPTRLHPKLARDLETICLKCLHKDANKRYASSGELADDLKRYLDGEPIQARATPAWERALKWCQRRPATAALIAVSVAAVVALSAVGHVLAAQARSRAEEERQHAQQETGLRQEAEAQRQIAVTQKEHADEQRKIAVTEKERADEQRARAQRRYRDALSAVDQMLTTVSQEHLKRLPGFKTVRTDLLVKARDFYARLLLDQAANVDVYRESALAFQRLGAIQSELGDYRNAEESYARAIERLTKLLDDGSTHADDSQALLAAQVDLGSVRTKQERYAEAEQAFAAAEKEWGRLQTLTKDDPGWRREFLADLHFNRANLLARQEQRPAAASEFVKAAAIYQELATANVKQPIYRFKLATTFTSLASVRPAAEAKAIEDDLNQAMTALTELVRLSPDKEDYKFEKARTHLNRGTLRFSTAPQEGKAAARASAVADLNEAIVLAKRLSDASRGAVPDYLELQVLAYMNLGLIHRDLKLWPEAKKAWTNAIPLCESLADQREYRVRLGLCRFEQGVALAESGAAKDALDALDRAVEVQTKLFAERKKTVADWVNLDETSYRRVRVLAELGRTAEAMEACQKLSRYEEEWAKAVPGGSVEQAQARTGKLLEELRGKQS